MNSSKMTGCSRPSAASLLPKAAGDWEWQRNTLPALAIIRLPLPTCASITTAMMVGAQRIITADSGHYILLIHGFSLPESLQVTVEARQYCEVIGTSAVAKRMMALVSGAKIV